MGAQARQWKLGVKRATVREKYKGTQAFLDRLKRITEDVSIKHFTFLHFTQQYTVHSFDIGVITKCFGKPEFPACVEEKELFFK
jgi:hypothetical protein